LIFIYFNYYIIILKIYKNQYFKFIKIVKIKKYLIKLILKNYQLIKYINLITMPGISCKHIDYDADWRSHRQRCREKSIPLQRTTQTDTQLARRIKEQHGPGWKRMPLPIIYT